MTVISEEPASLRLGALEREIRELKRTQERQEGRIEALERIPGEEEGEEAVEESRSRGFLLFLLVTALMFLAWCTQGPVAL